MIERPGERKAATFAAIEIYRPACIRIDFLADLSVDTAFREIDQACEFRYLTAALALAAFRDLIALVRIMVHIWNVIEEEAAGCA